MENSKIEFNAEKLEPFFSDLIDTQFSTTLMLEANRNEPLKVLIDEQMKTSSIIKRISKLYFSSVDSPLIYSISHINNLSLSEQERNLILEHQIPLGKLFSRLHGPKSIKKYNLEVEKSAFTHIANKMHLDSKMLFKKKYDFFINNRHVAFIEEYFSPESIQRT